MLMKGWGNLFQFKIINGKSYDNDAKCLTAELTSLYGQNNETRISEID
jgi:hypothetical protein